VDDTRLIVRIISSSGVTEKCSQVGNATKEESGVKGFTSMVNEERESLR
jgi:hypothetical protein